ncbi:MAG: hypothetical protein GC151_18435 [Betaproteobacteria bacterium]|nr:hypothetical protein [Betaproteobacteria bacterium]
MNIVPSGKAALTAGLLTAAFLLGQGASVAEETDRSALLDALPGSKLTLAQGLAQATKGTEVPISAKFELDDNRQLSLSVYTAAKGLAVDPEHNVLTELAASPATTPWTPESEVFKDFPHIARASEQLTLAAMANYSLADVVHRAQTNHRGTVFSITPVIHESRPAFDVLVADGDKVSEYVYDARTGAQVAMK